MKIKIYISDNNDKFIEKSTAYVLGLIDVQKFYDEEEKQYKISDNLLVFLENKYNVDFITKENNKHN